MRHIIKVFLVEDEVIIRQSIKNNVEWEKYGYEFVGEAADGEMALPLIKELKPDILITDIKMPFMDGVELGKILKEEMPGISIIFLTGYNDFSFAKEAISIGVEEYLMKPVTGNQLIAALDKVKDKIEKNKIITENMSRLEKESQKNIQIRRYRFFGELVRSKIPVSKLITMGNELGISIMASAYAVILIKFYFNHLDDEERKCQAEEVNMLLSKADSQQNAVMFQRATEGYIFLLKVQSDGEIDKVRERFLDQIKTIASGFEDLGYFVGVGETVHRIHEISHSYDTASVAFAKQYEMEKNRIIYYSELDKKEERDDISVNIDFREINMEKTDKSVLVKFLKSGAKEDADGFVENYFKAFGEKNMESFLFRQYIVLDICVIINEFLKQIQGAKKYAADKMFGENYKFSDVDTLEKTKSYVKKLITMVINLRSERVIKKYQPMIEEATEYIKEHFSDDDMSLNAAASIVGLSPSHFSTVFRQEVGSTFVEYLTMVRMEEAKTLLKCTSLKSSEIGYRIGYKDPHYFSFLFKKTQKCTPKEYRMKGI